MACIAAMAAPEYELLADEPEKMLL